MRNLVHVNPSLIFTYSVNNIISLSTGTILMITPVRNTEINDSEIVPFLSNLQKYFVAPAIDVF